MTLTAGSPSWNLSFSEIARQPELPLQIKLEEENESGYTLAAKAFSGSVCIASCSVSVHDSVRSLSFHRLFQPARTPGSARFAARFPDN